MAESSPTAATFVPLPTTPPPDPRLRDSWGKASRFTEHISTVTGHSFVPSLSPTSISTSPDREFQGGRNPNRFTLESTAPPVPPLPAARPSWLNSARASQRDVESGWAEKSALGRSLTWSARISRISRALHRKSRSDKYKAMDEYTIGKPWPPLNIVKLNPAPSPANVLVLEDPLPSKKPPPRKEKWPIWIWVTVVLVILALIAVVICAVLFTRGSKGTTASKASANTTVSASASGASVTAVPVTYNVSFTLPPMTFVTTIGTTIITTVVTPSPTAVLTTSTPSTTSTSTTTTSSSSASSTPTLSPELQSCLTSFNLSAPTDPIGYDCSTCAPLLASIPNDLAPSPASPSSALPTTGQGAALQFCALQAVFVAAATTAGNASAAPENPLSSIGWMLNALPCTWSGVACDGLGRVTDLKLAFPAVPAALPALMGGMVALQNLEVTGNGIIPAGSLPSSLLNITSLTSIQLQSTAITTLPDSAFSQLPHLTHLILAGNPQMGTALPSSIQGLSLQSLVVNGQNLGGDILQSLVASSSLASSLQTLDLSSNQLTSPMPDALSNFTSLQELNLASNNLTALPTAFPASLRTLSLAQNTQLQGTMPQALCASTALTSCDLRETELTGGSNSTDPQCGVCLFH